MHLRHLMIASFFILVLITGIRAQADVADLNSMSTRGLSDVDVSVFNLNENTTLGSPLLTPDWKPGHLMLVEQDSFGYSVDVNLDFFKQQLYFRLTNGHINVITTKFVKAVLVDTSATRSLLFRVFPKGDVEGGKSDELNFYQVLYEGPEYSLLKSYTKTFLRAEPETPYGTSRTYNEYREKTFYWLKVGDHPYEKLKLQAKSVEKALSGEKAKIKELKGWNTFDLDTEEGAAKLLKLLDNAK